MGAKTGYWLRGVSLIKFKAQSPAWIGVEKFEGNFAYSTLYCTE